MASGAHSVSDYARDLVCADGHNLGNPASPRRSAPSHFRSGLATTRLEAEVSTLRRHFEEIKTELKQLTERVEQMPPSEV